MHERAAIDVELDSVNDWIHRAGEALLSFFNPTQGVFWRDNDEILRRDKGKSPTSTLRAFIALVSLLQVLEEDDPRDGRLLATAQDAARGVATRYLTQSPDRRDVRWSGTNEFNAFTDSQLLMSVALLSTLSRLIRPVLKVDPKVAIGNVRSVVDALKRAIRNYCGAPMTYDRVKRGRITQAPHAEDERPNRHDFITLYAIRGLDALNESLDERTARDLQTRLRDDVLHQLGYRFAEVSSRLDPAELAFTITLLDRLPTPDTPTLRDAAVDVIVRSQLPSGAWPPARLVVYSERKVLHIASFEVALTLSYLLRAHSENHRTACCGPLLGALRSTFGLIQSSFRETSNARGWCNDHARSQDLVESWTTAIVLMFLVQYREILMDLRQSEILAKYRARQHSVRSPQKWRDMRTLMRLPEAVHPEALDNISDPTDGRALTAALRAQFREPVLASPLARPVAASLILYGPPGTRKTTLMVRLAEALGWPLITLSPPNFLQHGLDGFEAEAADLFEDLFRLRRVVVFFDESEDFFKKRQPEQPIESRTIGAFITAGMLPRLQELRDRRWVIFALATNSSLEELDPAVIRPGRFDFGFKMSHPTKEAAIEYVVKRLRTKQRDDLVRDARAVLGGVDFCEPTISFAILDLLLKRVLFPSKHSPGVDQIRKCLFELRNMRWPENLA